MQVCETVSPIFGLGFKSVNALRGFRYIEGESGGGAGAATAGAEGEGASSATGDASETAEIDYKAKFEESQKHSRTWEQRAKDNKAKADAHDAVEAEKLTEVEKERNRATAAELAATTSAGELLQLRTANTHGITAAERALLTATTEDALKEQAEAIVALRAPGTASAKDAGITGGGSASANKPKSLGSALNAHYAKK